MWTSSEYVFIYFVWRSVSRFFHGHLQCNDRDNKDSDDDNSPEQIFLQHLSSLGIRQPSLITDSHLNLYLDSAAAQAYGIERTTWISLLLF